MPMNCANSKMNALMECLTATYIRDHLSVQGICSQNCCALHKRMCTCDFQPSQFHTLACVFAKFICILGQHFKVADAWTDLLLGAPFAFRNPPPYAPVHRVLTTGPVCFDLCNQESTHIN